MTDRNLLEVEEKDLAEENSLDSQDENPYLSSAKELYREKEISRRKKVVETMRQQDEALRRNQSIAVTVSDEEMALREEKAEQRLKIREESFGRNNGYEVPLSRDEEVLLKKKAAERGDKTGEALDVISSNITDMGTMQRMMLPEEHKKLLDMAAVLKVKPSVLYGMDPIDMKWIEEQVKFKAGGIDLSVTPVVSKFISNPRVAAIASDSRQNMQLIEDRIRRQKIYNSLLNNENLHSTSTFDNFAYAMGRLDTLKNWGYTYGLNKLDEKTTELFSHVLSDERKQLAFTAAEMRKEARGISLLNFAQEMENRPRDMRSNHLGEVYDSKGLTASLKYLKDNPGIIWTATVQEAPTLLLGGPAGKIITKPIEIGLKKMILSELTKKMLTKVSQAGVVGALSSSTNYSANLVKAQEKHNDINKALSEANKRTSIEAAFGALSGMLPDKLIGGKGRLAKAANGLLQTELGVGVNTLGNYVAAKSVGEDVTGGELWSNFLLGNVTATVGAGVGNLSNKSYFGRNKTNNKKIIDDLIKPVSEAPLTSREPNVMRAFINEVLQETDSTVKDVYLPVDKFVKYFDSKGVDPFSKADELTGHSNSLQEAMDLGTQLKIPVSNYLIDVIAAGHSEAFKQDVTESPRGMTENELSTLNNKQAKELPKIFEKVNKELEVFHDQTLQSKVFNDVRLQLINVGEKEINAEHKALLYWSFFEKMAKHTEVDATTLYSKYKLKITKDNLKNLDTTHTRYAQTGKSEDLFKPHSDQAENYRNKLESAVNSLVSRDITLDLGGTPIVLQAVGAPNLPLKITRDVVRKATNNIKHNVSMDTIKSLPEFLSDPIALFKSSTEENSLVALVDAIDESKRPVIVAVHLNYTEKRNIQINKIASVYGKDNIDGFVKRETSSGRLLYSKNEESQNLVRSDGLQLPVDGSPNRGSDKSVLRPSDIVKYEQRKDGNTNGFIEIDNDGSVKINVNSTANLSTFLHETGHFFLHSLTDIASMPEAKPELKTDLAAIHQWLKVDETKGFTRKQHEQFARGFEAYLMTGKAPSPELKGAFERFKGWLIEVYRDVRNLNVPLSDEVRQVFDRMLVSDKSVDQVKSSTKLLFDNALEANMTAREYTQYQKNYSAMEGSAREKLFRRLVLEQKRIATKDWQEKQTKVRDEVSKEVNQEPVYRVLGYLEEGILLDGTKGKSYKMDRQLIKDQFGEKVARQVKHLTTNRDGVSPEALADVFGFSSATEMISALRKAPNKHLLINIETDARMAKKYGDTLNDGTITEKAIELLENEHKANVLKQEIKALFKEVPDQAALEEGNNIKTIDDTDLSNEYLNNIAEQILLQKKVADINPDLYLVAGRSANQEAYEALKKGSIRLVMEAKQRELLNHVLYIKALELKRSYKNNAVHSHTEK